MRCNVYAFISYFENYEEGEYYIVVFKSLKYFAMTDGLQ